MLNIKIGMHNIIKRNIFTFNEDNKIFKIQNINANQMTFIIAVE